MQASSLITDEYRELNRQLHEDRDDYGRSGEHYAEMVLQIATAIKAGTILDYGCGKQTLANKLPHAPIIGYDPCIFGLDEPPAPADMVVCTDVLEHIEPALLDNVLDDLRALTKKVIFLTVATRPAKKTLADGRNAHLIVKPYDWWLPKLIERFRLDTFNRVGEGMFVISMSNKDWNDEID